MGKAEEAVNIAVSIANDDSHGYSQSVRWGPDYDCSSLVISVWTQCGVDVKGLGASYTGNMLPTFLKAGFRKVNPVLENLERGDVLLNIAHHTALYIGDGKIVQATIAETGNVYGEFGDQTGGEIGIFPYYDYPWDYVLRYTGKDETTSPAPDPFPLFPGANYGDENICYAGVPMLQAGYYGPAVAALQGALNYHGFGSVEVDGDLGPETELAVRQFQKRHNLEIDGIVGPITWGQLFYWR